MRVLTTLPQDDLNAVPAAARAAEAAGYDGLVTSENQNEPFLALGVAAVNTTRIGLGTGIANRLLPESHARGQRELGPPGRLRRALRPRPGLAGPRPQRAALQRAVERAGAADARVRRSAPRHLALLGDLIQDIRRIPSAFTGYRTAW